MLSVRNIGFHYRPEKEILKDVSFSLRKGEVLCLLGSNGTGKTTLLKCLLGLLRPSSGEAQLLGENLLGVSAKKRAKMISYVPQSSALNFPYTVQEAVMMGRLPHLGFGSSPTAKDHREVEATLEEMGITDLAQRYFQQLSGGEKQLVIIARALAQRASLLILDEPTSSLDFFNQARTLKLIKKLAQQGNTVLLTTHSPDQAFLIADQVVMIKNGSVFACGRSDEVITDDNLTGLYGLHAVVSSTSVISAGKNVKVCIPILDSTPS
ncbi:MAG: ABC transporter ATP-binding protein [Betaproteobacteria bacterium]|nr:ABC transporter ATP-binding protein [Betaproteobacteria bacterium]